MASARSIRKRQRSDLVATRIGRPAARRVRSSALRSNASRSTIASGGSSPAVARSYRARSASPVSLAGPVLVPAGVGAVLVGPGSVGSVGAAALPPESADMLRTVARRRGNMKTCGHDAIFGPGRVAELGWDGDGPAGSVVPAAERRRDRGGSQGGGRGRAAGTGARQRALLYRGCRHRRGGR